MHKKVLLFFPANKTTIAMISLFKALRAEGVEMELLTILPKDVLHHQLEELGFKTHSLELDTNPISWYKLISKSYRFFKASSATVIFSHLKPCTLVTLVLEKFISQKVFSFRHHIDHPDAIKQFPELINKNQLRGDALLNKFAPNQIVPCKTVMDGMIKEEKANPNRLSIIPYMYDFDMYPKADTNWINNERLNKKAQLRILLCSRLVPVKRHMLALQVLKKLIIDKQLDIQVYILDKGPEEEKIQKYINENQLNNNVTMVGFTQRYIDYMALCDVLLHPSVSEASNSVVKEMALQGTPSIVCAGVGDFSDYIVHGENGFLIKVLNPQEEIESIVMKIYHDKSALSKIGEEAKKSVLNLFSINRETTFKYITLLESVR